MIITDLRRCLVRLVKGILLALDLEEKIAIVDDSELIGTLTNLFASLQFMNLLWTDMRSRLWRDSAVKSDFSTQNYKLIQEKLLRTVSSL